jgi:hypothetical protein
MKLSLIGVSVVALTAFAIMPNAASAVEKGQGCDLRGVPGSGCKPGRSVQPAGKNDAGGAHGPSNNSGAGSSGNVDIKRSHGGGGDQPHVNPKSQ